MNLILITGRASVSPLTERNTVERALYSGWTVIRWEADVENFVGLLRGEDWVDPQYQVGRLQSFGTWGVRLNPDVMDVFDAFHHRLFAS